MICGGIEPTTAALLGSAGIGAGGNILSSIIGKGKGGGKQPEMKTQMPSTPPQSIVSRQQPMPVMQKPQLTPRPSLAMEELKKGGMNV